MSTILRSRRMAPVAAVALGVLTLGLTVANVPLDRLSHQPGSLLDYTAGIGLEGRGPQRVPC